MRRWLVPLLVAFGCNNGPQKGRPRVEIPLAHAPKCSPGNELVQQIPMVASCAHETLQSAITGRADVPATLSMQCDKGDLKIEFGTYAQRTLPIDPIDPSTLHAEFVNPPDWPMRCTDGQLATTP
jgi:hypothetical protein